MKLLGRASDPIFWSEEVRNGECYKAYVAERNRDWIKYCENAQIDELKYTDFRRFFIDGDRGIYQKPYYTRRGQLATSAIMALIYPDEQKYIDYLNDTNDNKIR